MAADNSFDVVSEVDLMEVSNAIQQAIKEIRQRFDFKGSVSDVTLEKEILTLTSDDENKLKSVTDIVQTKLVKRRLAQSARLRHHPACDQGIGPPARDHQEGNCLRKGQGDRKVHQGNGREGPGRHSGGSSPSVREEAGRSSDDHASAQGPGLRH